MAKSSRRRPRLNAGQQIDRMARESGPMNYPKSIPEAIERGDRMVQAMAIRNQRQKDMLTRASALMEQAVDECTCGGVNRAIASFVKGEGDGEVAAPEQEGD